MGAYPAMLPNRGSSAAHKTGSPALYRCDPGSSSPTFPFYHDVKSVLPDGVLGFAGNHAAVHRRTGVILLPGKTAMHRSMSSAPADGI